MRRFLFCLGFSSLLFAQAPLRVVSVDRRGLPPYEASDRLYRLDGGTDRGLRAGNRLLVKRAGETTALGHFQVLAVRAGECEASFEPSGATFPMKGDLALREELKAIPAAPSLEPGTLMVPEGPRSSPEPPPQEGVLFFLPHQGELSPAGVRKLEAWAEAWGASGHWTIQVPAVKTVKPALQKRRAESLLGALRALGIEHVELGREPRVGEGKYEPVWIRHRD
jgi:hypothetical protein